MNPNTFKSGDRFKIFGDGGVTRTVNYITGPYIAYNDLDGFMQTVHHTNCELVENEFSPGDIVRHKSEPTNTGEILEKVGGYYRVKWNSSYGVCTDPAHDLILVSRANAIDDFLKAGKYIEAIKEYRVRHGVGLKEAKDAIDSLRAQPIVSTIVVRFDVGKGYRPNDNPRVHNSVAEATAEAERLAYANPGVKFDTFTLVTSSRCDVPTVVTVKA